MAAEKNTDTQIKKQFEKFDDSGIKNPPRYDLRKDRLLEDKTETSIADELDKKLERLDKSASFLSDLMFIASRL